MKILSIPKRLRWIIDHVPKTRSGKPMTCPSLSLAAGLSRGDVGIMIADPTRLDMTRDTAECLAWAAGVSLNWLQTGRGSPSDADVPEHRPPLKRSPKYRRFGNYPDYAPNLALAMAEGLIDPPEASAAGADLPVPSGYRPPYLTPERVRAACLFAWYLSSENRKGDYSDAFHQRRRKNLRLEARRRESGPPVRLVQ